MQTKAPAVDSEHPNHPLGTRSAAEYAAAIRCACPEQEQLQVGAWLLAAGAQAMGLLIPFMRGRAVDSVEILRGSALRKLLGHRS